MTWHFQTPCFYQIFKIGLTFFMTKTSLLIFNNYYFLIIILILQQQTIAETGQSQIFLTYKYRNHWPATCIDVSAPCPLYDIQQSLETLIYQGEPERRLLLFLFSLGRKCVRWKVAKLLFCVPFSKLYKHFNV